MNDSVIKNLHDDRFGDIMIVLENGILWFSADAVAKALGYKGKASKNSIKNHVCSYGKKKIRVKTNGGEQDVYFVNESGLNSLILKNRTSFLNEFVDWIYLDVIPTVRKACNYYI